MIWLVGAGPGDAGLLTLRGREVLARADIVIYDRLVSDGVLALIPEGAEMIDAGKSSGSHTLKQRDIEALMIDRALSGKNVVRLKGGDPFMFGRGGEEAEALIAAGLAFGVVPGVRSALAVPAYAGIPATHRDYCSGASIFTAHDRDNLIPDFTDTSSIFLMGVSHAKELQERLTETLSPGTPCAVIQDGTTSGQRVFRCSVGSLHDTVITNGITPPAVIIAGKAAGLNLDWRGNLPLNGKRVIITRPSGRGERLAGMLRDAGAEVIMMPTIKTAVIHHALDGVNLSGYDWAGFTSVTGVDAFFELLAESCRDIRELGGTKIAAIGQATADALRRHGLKTDYMPEIFDGTHMAEGLSGNVLMFRALNGSAEIDEALRKHAKNFVQVCIYRTDYVKLTHVPKFTDIIIFTSASTVRGFAENINGMREAQAVCIGKQTAHEAERAGFTRIRIAGRATEQDLYSAVVSCL